jgi:acyl-CoA dehydrogenase
VLDFTLTPDQRALQAKGHAFSEEVLRPVCRHYDVTGEWAEPVFQRAWEQGLLQSCVPSEWGGAGLTHLEEAVLFEEIAWGCAGFFTALSCNGLATMPLRLAGTGEQQQSWFTRLMESPRFAAFALSEPGAGSDVSAIATTAVKRWDAYVLNGTKCYCTCGDVADFVVVFATIDPEKGARGITAFIVPRNTRGMRVGKVLDKMGQRASRQVELIFEDAVVPEANRLGAEGTGFTLAMNTLDRTRATVAAGAVGLARAAFELALDFAKSRIQFGTPIINHQAVGFMLADMAKKVEAARLLTWQAAWMADNKQKNSKQSAMAKTFATDTAMEVATDAVQILGGHGYSREFLAEKFFRDAKLMQIYEGTNQIQRMIIAKEIQREGC